MPSVLAFYNLATAANLSSPQSFETSLPLSNAAGRQVSVKARRTAAGDTEYRIDLGENRVIGCLGLLGHNHDDATGTVSYRYQASLVSFADDSAYDETETTTPALRRSLRAPHYVHVPAQGIFARYWRITVSAATLSDPMDVGVIWISEVFGLGGSAAIDTVPPIDITWQITPADATQTDESRGGQAYARGSTRLRTLTCRYSELPYANAIGVSSGTIADLEYIGELVGSEFPCIMIARSDDNYVLHRTMVYGRQTQPWRLAHTAGGQTGAGFFGIDLEFRAEN